MATDTPAALAQAFSAAVASGEVSSAADLWLEDAKIIQPDGHAIEGRDAVVAALQALSTAGPSSRSRSRTYSSPATSRSCSAR